MNKSVHKRTIRRGVCVSDGFYFKVLQRGGSIFLPVMLSICTLVFSSSCFVSQVEGSRLRWLPLRLGDDQQAPAKHPSGFGGGGSVLFLWRRSSSVRVLPGDVSHLLAAVTEALGPASS